MLKYKIRLYTNRAIKQTLFLILLILWVSGPLSGRNQAVFRLDSIPGVIPLDSGWVYHKGDSLNWAGTDYDDTKWVPFATDIMLSKSNPPDFDGKGWFRLHLQIDSSLTNKNLTFMMSQQGASEIYINGKMVQRIGIIGDEVSEEQTLDPRLIPITYHMSGDTDYLIAVRYSNLAAWKRFQRFNAASAGFNLSVATPDDSQDALLSGYLSGNMIIFIFAVFVILGLLHFLLYLFYRKNKSNLYYSIFSLLFSVMIFSVLSRNVSITNPGFNIVLGYFISISIPVLLITLIGFIYSVFYEKPPIYFWIFIGLGVISSTLYVLSFRYIEVLYLGMVVLVFVEIFRVVFRAIRKKIDGAWIIGTGVISFLLLMATLITSIIILGNFSIQGGGFLNYLLLITVILAILSIPISMSLYLARDFAVTNKNLLAQLVEVKRLSALTLEQELEKKRILEGQKEKLEILVRERTKELEEEKDTTEKLLHNILPAKVVDELKATGITEPENFENVTVFFSDIIGFTTKSNELEPKVLIQELNELFTAFDDIMTGHNCERIKTIGDAYMAVSGMPEADKGHAGNMARASLDIMKYLKERNTRSVIKWEIRAGIHTGKVVGGVVGVRKYIYDVFGDTINTTARMEQYSEAMKINVSDTTYNILREDFRFAKREPMEIKGKGIMSMYFLKEG